jgi:FkbM family methyltransferase
MLTTRQKIAVARLASLGLRGARRLAGLPDETRVRRGGVRWALDLKEGIDLAVYLGQYQPIPARFRERISGSAAAVLDIGANVGAFTLPIARLLGPEGRVLAIEPTDYAYAKLRRNLHLNPDLAARVTAAQALLVARDEAEAEKPDGIYASWPVGGAAGTHPLHLGAQKTVEGAQALTLDRLVRESEALAGREIAAVKLDVDGHEAQVLAGAGETLRRHRPLILIEIAPYIQDERPDGLQEVLDRLAENGYHLVHPTGGQRVEPRDPDVRRLVPHGASLDFLAAPND